MSFGMCHVVLFLLFHEAASVNSAAGLDAEKRTAIIRAGGAVDVAAEHASGADRWWLWDADAESTAANSAGESSSAWWRQAGEDNKTATVDPAAIAKAEEEADAKAKADARATAEAKAKADAKAKSDATANSTYVGVDLKNERQKPQKEMKEKPHVGKAKVKEFYFGDAKAPAGDKTTSIVRDDGMGYGERETTNGKKYGWSCAGVPITAKSLDPNYGKVNRRSWGINFDRYNRCKAGSEYPPVSWELEVPDGFYAVDVTFPTGFRSKCEVEGINAGCGNSTDTCVFSQIVRVADGRFTVTGSAHESQACHSLAKVRISKAEHSQLQELENVSTFAQKADSPQTVGPGR